MAAVTKNTATVVPSTLPARLALPILAMAEEMEQKTIGTTMQNMRLMNTVPRGSSAVAPGQTAPVMHPAIMAKSMERMNQ